MGLFDGTTDEVAFDRARSFLSRIERIVTPAIERTPALGVEAPDPEDGSAEREIGAMVAAGVESRDARAAATLEPVPPPSAADVQRLFAGLSVQRTAHGGLVIEAPPETFSTLAALFAGMAQLLQAATLPSAPQATIAAPLRDPEPASRRSRRGVTPQSAHLRSGLLFSPHLD